MASSPAILPITTNPDSSSATPIQTPAFGLFISHITTTVSSALSHRRPWTELIDRTAFSKPDSLSEAALRVRKNYSYFRTNYLTLAAIVISVSLLTNPFALIALLALLAAWVFLYLCRPSDPPLVILGRTLSERETLGVLVIASVVVVFLTSVGSVLISAMMVGVGIVCLHGAFRMPEDLFLDEEGPAATGFLSFLSGPAPGTAGAAGVGHV